MSCSSAKLQSSATVKLPAGEARAAAVTAITAPSGVDETAETEGALMVRLATEASRPNRGRRGHGARY